MSADLEFLDELVAGMDAATLDWLQIRIARRLAGMRPEIVERRTIIIK